MVMIGAWLAVTGLLSQKGIKESLPQVVSKRNLRYNDINETAIDMGYEFAKNAG
jgi:Pyruvate/2-oxoacid:ferredoxin oxidoreductase gamma subunit